MNSTSRVPRLTAADLAALPEDGVRHELRAGFLLSEPRPFPRHAQIQARLIELIAPFVRRHGLGQVLADAGFMLSRDPDTVRGPDVSFVAAARWVDAGNEDRFFPGAPELAIEVLSPSNRPAEVRAKLADYVAAGSSQVWIVDPKSGSVTVHRAGAAPRRYGPGDTLAVGDLLPGLTIDLAWLFER